MFSRGVMSKKEIRSRREKECFPNDGGAKETSSKVSIM